MKETNQLSLNIVTPIRFLSFLLLLTCSMQSVGQNYEKPIIIKKPVNYNKERVALSLDYLKNRHGLIQEKPTIIPKIIVLHYTAGGSITSVFNYFNQTTIEAGRPYNKNQSNLNVSAHYLIDRDGTIYNLIPDTLFARHAIGINYCAIGIENIGSQSAPLTEAQAQANAALVRFLCNLYPIEYVIGHSEYGKLKKTSFWKESNPKYFTQKVDPGQDFLIKVRSLIKDLKLKSLYE